MLLAISWAGKVKEHTFVCGALSVWSTFYQWDNIRDYLLQQYLNENVKKGMYILPSGDKIHPKC